MRILASKPDRPNRCKGRSTQCLVIRVKTKSGHGTQINHSATADATHPHPPQGELPGRTSLSYGIRITPIRPSVPRGYFEAKATSFCNGQLAAVRPMIVRPPKIAATGRLSGGCGGEMVQAGVFSLAWVLMSTNQNHPVIMGMNGWLESSVIIRDWRRDRGRGEGPESVENHQIDPKIRALLGHKGQKIRPKSDFRVSCKSLMIRESGRLDSNQRPLEPHSSALPSCATARFVN
jgi:hypothetical protein